MRTTTLAVLLLAATCAQAQYKNTFYDQITASEDNLLGKVKDVTESYYNMHGSDTTAMYRAHQRYTHDGLREHHELVGHQVLDAYDYQYTDGRLVYVENTYTQYISPTILSNQYEKTNKRYDHYTHTADGCPEKRVHSMVNDDGDSIEATTFFQCDPSCRILASTGVFAKSFHYDELGRIDSCAYENTGSTSTYEYDELWHITKISFTEGTLSGSIVYSYNTNGFEEDVEYSDSDGNRQHVHYDYTYDNHGNWLTRSDGSTLIKRKITYYE